MSASTGEFFDKNLMHAIRDRFMNVESDPYSGKRIYFENAGGSLTLKTVIDVVARQIALPDNAGRGNPASKEIDKVIAAGREDIRLLLGARSGIVAMGESATNLAFRVIDVIARNVPGENIITTNLDHPAIYDSTRLISERYGKEWRAATLDPKTGIVNPEQILKHLDENTLLLAIIHSSNNLGTKNDVEEIIRQVRKVKPDVYILVDGSQHIAHYPVDVDALGCDAYVFSTYKAFSKTGASFAYLSDRASRLPHDKLAGSAETNWELGTRDQSGYAAWSQVADYLCWLGGHFTESTDRRELITAGMDAIELHERALTNRLLNGSDGLMGLLQMDNVEIYGEVKDLTVREPVIAMNFRNMGAREADAWLGEKGIRVCTRHADYYSKHTLDALGIDGCLRVSLAHYNTPEEVDFFLKTAAEVGNEL